VTLTKWVFLGFAVIAGFFLIQEHRATLTLAMFPVLTHISAVPLSEN
jgi:hypothetical protein